MHTFFGDLVKRGVFNLVDEIPSSTILTVVMDSESNLTCDLMTEVSL